MDSARVHELAVTAANARLLALDMVHTAASGHIGGSLSSIDLLTVLYFEMLRTRTATVSSSPRATAPPPSTPFWP